MAITFDKYGETPLDDISGLKLKNITTKKELDDAESINIAKAYLKFLIDFSPRKKQQLDEPFLREIHKVMLGDVWSWAGTYRTTQTTIGINAAHIQTSLYQLCDDLKYWEKQWEIKETATRLHHKLVYIHPFPNGNGRWARLATEIWLTKMGHTLPVWGKPLGTNARTIYIEALKQADNKNYKPLEHFMFSEI